MEHLLVYDTNERFNCKQALEHPFLAKYHDKDDEPESEVFDDKNDLENHTVDELRSILNILKNNFNLFKITILFFNLSINSR